VLFLFMALLSFRGISTPSLPAQGEQRRFSLLAFQHFPGHLLGLGAARSLATTVTPSAPDDPHLIDTLFVVQDNALWVAGCRRTAASLFALVAVLSSCRHKDVICAIAQRASGPKSHATTGPRYGLSRHPFPS
jgi:hypothetical protein